MSQIKSSDITDSVSQISWITLSGCSLSVIVIIVLIALIVIIIILVIVSQWVGVLGVVWCVSGRCLGMSEGARKVSGGV